MAEFADVDPDVEQAGTPFLGVGERRGHRDVRMPKHRSGLNAQMLMKTGIERRTNQH
jgi:hypothetical protein